MTDATFAQAAVAAAWIALTVFLVAVSVGLIMAVCTIAKAWKKITRQIDQDEAEAKRVREERRNLKMVIEATCMDCGQTFRYNRIRKPKEPMKRCPKCARKHYASKYLAKHRVDMLVKALRKVQAYCAGQQHGCRECALYDHDQEVCRISGCGPAAWSIGSGSDEPGRKGV